LGRWKWNIRKIEIFMGKSLGNLLN
jgi:hypothetical protein